MPQPYFKTNSLQALFGTVNIWFNGAGNDSVYYLPYDDTYRLCIQWGSRASISNDGIHTVTYAVAYATGKSPTTFTQQIGTSGAINYAPVVITNSISRTSFQVLPSGGGNGGNENGFNWFSIGLV